MRKVHEIVKSKCIDIKGLDPKDCEFQVLLAQKHPNLACVVLQNFSDSRLVPPLLKAVESGCEASKLALAKCYLTGKVSAIKQDTKKAMALLSSDHHRIQFALCLMPDELSSTLIKPLNNFKFDSLPTDLEFAYKTLIRLAQRQSNRARFLLEHPWLCDLFAEYFLEIDDFVKAIYFCNKLFACPEDYGYQQALAFRDLPECSIRHIRAMKKERRFTFAMAWKKGLEDVNKDPNQCLNFAMTLVEHFMRAGRVLAALKVFKRLNPKCWNHPVSQIFCLQLVAKGYHSDAFIIAKTLSVDCEWAKHLIAFGKYHPVERAIDLSKGPTISNKDVRAWIIPLFEDARKAGHEDGEFILQCVKGTICEWVDDPTQSSPLSRSKADNASRKYNARIAELRNKL